MDGFEDPVIETEQLAGVRHTSKSVCRGVVLYLFLFVVLQYLLYAEYGLASFALPAWFPEEISEFMFGTTILVSTLVSLITAWLYFAGERERGTLFFETDPEAAPDYRRNRSFLWEVFETRRQLPIPALLGCAGLVFVLQVAFVYITDFLELFFNQFGLTLQYSEALNADYSTSWTLLLYAVCIGPLAEEIVYRGFVLRGMQSNGKVFAIVVSSLIFGLMHGDFQQSLFTFAAGLVFGYVAMEYGLKYSLLLHIFNNGILGELWTWLSGRASDTVYMISVFAVLVLSAIGTVYLIRTAGKSVRDFFQNEPRIPGAWKSMLNFWFLLFLSYAASEIVFSVQPL